MASLPPTPARSRPSSQTVGTPRPAVATVAAALVALAALLTAAELLYYRHLLTSDGVHGPSLVRLAATFLVPAAAYGVLSAFLLRGASWARTAVTALAVVSVATEAPALLAAAVADGDATALLFLAPALPVLVAVPLLWTVRSRGWYGQPA